ncbi:MAG: hypothetical protein HY315_08315 [Acidobacteria bacterium]|nr:hypothetical protein [Acidobacteriota bacterium]
MRRKRLVRLGEAVIVLVGGIGIWVGTGNRTNLVLAQEAASPAKRQTVIIKREPSRVVVDPNPTFAGIAIAPERGELFVAQDNDAFSGGTSLDVYSLDFTPSLGVSEPRRRIAGPMTQLGKVCDVAVAPEFREIYAVEGEGSGIKAFPIDATGNVAPLREVYGSSRGTWGLIYEPKFDEIYVAMQHVNKIAVYRRNFQFTDDPLRWIQGPKTQLATPHGIYVDVQSDEIYIINHGNWRNTEPGETQFTSVPRELLGRIQNYWDIRNPLVPSGGKFVPPSITVFSRTANGNVEPLRVIQGPKTGLNMPLGIFLDTKSNQLAVASSGDNRVLFFDAKAQGDVAPVRVLGGPATGLSDPVDVVIDRIRDELWVSNWTGHSVRAFPRTAEGNVQPLRVIRSSPEGTPATGFGRPSGIVYNPKRKEFLVPN